MFLNLIGFIYVEHCKISKYIYKLKSKLQILDLTKIIPIVCAYIFLPVCVFTKFSQISVSTITINLQHGYIMQKVKKKKKELDR